MRPRRAGGAPRAADGGGGPPRGAGGYGAPPEAGAEQPLPEAAAPEIAALKARRERTMAAQAARLPLVSPVTQPPS